MARTCDNCRDRDARVRCLACFRAEQIERRAQPADAEVSADSAKPSDMTEPDEAAADAADPIRRVPARLNDGQIAHRRAMLAHLTYKLRH